MLKKLISLRVLKKFWYDTVSFFLNGVFIFCSYLPSGRRNFVCFDFFCHVVLLIYFKFIPINIFESIKSTNLTPLTSFEQAYKNCDGISKKPKTFFQNLENFFDLKKGGGIGRELKKLNKTMNG